MLDLYDADVRQLGQGLLDRHFSAVPLVTTCLARIDEVKHLNAIVPVNPRAVEIAAEKDALLAANCRSAA